MCWELGSESVDPLDERCDAECFSESTDVVLLSVDESGYLSVRETLTLGGLHEDMGDRGYRPCCTELAVSVDDVLDFVEEPLQKQQNVQKRSSPPQMPRRTLSIFVNS